METPRNIKSKLEQLNDKIAKNNRSYFVRIDDGNLSKTASSLASTSTDIKNDFNSKKDFLDVETFVMNLDAELNALVQKQKDEINKWLNDQIAQLEEIGINVAKGVLDLLPKIKIPETVKQALEKIEEIKSQVEGKVLVATMNIDIIKDKAMLTAIEQAERQKFKRKEKQNKG